MKLSCCHSFLQQVVLCQNGSFEKHSNNTELKHTGWKHLNKQIGITSNFTPVSQSTSHLMNHKKQQVISVYISWNLENRTSKKKILRLKSPSNTAIFTWDSSGPSLCSTINCGKQTHASVSLHEYITFSGCSVFMKILVSRPVCCRWGRYKTAEQHITVAGQIVVHKDIGSLQVCFHLMADRCKCMVLSIAHSFKYTCETYLWISEWFVNSSSHSVRSHQEQK